jgi:predicted transcriptional regulator
MKSFKRLKAELLKTPSVKAAYEQLEPEYAIIERLIRKRLDQGVTQVDLAKMIGTKQSAISRFESGTYHPTLMFLHKVADALDAKLKITLS